MYDILFICRHCGVHLSADENDVGISMPCPECAKTISIPSGDILFECSECGKALIGSADSRGHSFHCPYCDLEVVVPEEGKRIPISETLDVTPEPEPTPPAPISVEDASRPTSSPNGSEKRQHDQFMMTWGSYMAQAGLTDEKDKKKKKRGSEQSR